MNRLESLPAAAFGFALLGAFYIGCTQDFSVFDPVETTSAGSTGEAATSSGPGGTGGDLSVSSSEASTGSNAGGAGGSNPAGTGGAGGSGPLEDCLNGNDDDGDGDTDCADADCMVTGFTCVDSAPNNWDGPVVLFAGAAAAKPECPATFPDKAYEGYGDPSGDPATCSACSCDPKDVDVNCITKNLLAYTQAGCAGQGFPVDLNPGDCYYPGPNQFTIQSYKQNAPDVFTLGSCTPSEVQETVPPPTWGKSALVCAGNSLGKGCGGGDVCAPKGQAPFEATVCIWRDGDRSCPPGYPDKHVYNNDPTDLEDTRGCTECACGDPSGTCTATTELYSDDKCMMKHNDVPNDGVCKDTMKGVSAKLIATTSATCQAQGGMPTGEVVASPSNVTTVCCAQ